MTMLPRVTVAASATAPVRSPAATIAAAARRGTRDLGLDLSIIRAPHGSLLSTARATEQTPPRAAGAGDRHPGALTKWPHAPLGLPKRQRRPQRHFWRKFL